MVQMHYISTPQKQYLLLCIHQPAWPKTGIGQLRNFEAQFLLSSVFCRGSAVPLQGSLLGSAASPALGTQLLCTLASS